MTNALPPAYADLAKESGPKMLLEMLKIFGTKEVPGDGDNPEILAWAKETGLDGIYKHDGIAWCGLAMALVATRARKIPPLSPLWALNWAKFGDASPTPMLGDVLTFKRDGGGHVTMYVGEDTTHYHCLGGNQSDQICITRIDRARLFMARRPSYKVQPTNVRVITRSATGPVSTNEA